MSKKHFIAIAAKIRTQIEMANNMETPESSDRCEAVQMAMAILANQLADEFATFSPNFQRQRFLTACGV